MIVGCLNIFESVNTIGKTLESIRDFCDRIIVVDGSYEGFSDHMRSEDGTMAIIKSFPKPRIEIGNSTGKQWKNEMHKRNQYLNPTWHMRDGKVTTDWILIIDGDEYVASGQEKTKEYLAKSKAPYHSVTVMSLTGTGRAYGRGTRLRLIRYVPGMRYVDNHHTIQMPDGTKITGRTSKQSTVAPLCIVHDQIHVSEERREMKNHYNDFVRPTLEKP